MKKRASSEPQTLGVVKKKRTLKPKELTFINHKVKGKSNARAVMDAGITKNPKSAKVIGHKLSKEPTIQEAIATELVRQGITITAVVKPIAEGLGAVRDIYDKEGNWLDSNPDHSIRLKSSGMALDLMGARSRGDSTVNINFNQHVHEQREKYGL